MRIISLLLSLIIAVGITAKEPQFYVIEIKGEINASSAKKLSKGLKEATSLEADYIILHINTYGGAVDAADSMRSSLIRAKVPTIVFIDKQAASAGALISIACDSIYMSRGGSIGAATVVNQTGEVMPDKYQSFMRAMMRATAEVKGRDPQIAEAMVNPSISIPGIVDSTKVLSFTAEEARKHNYCEGIAESVQEIAGLITKGEGYLIKYQKLSLLDRILLFFLNPVVQGILLMLIIGGIYFEFQTPGIGLPSIIAVTSALFYFSPLYIEGLAQYWEIILFVAGTLLLLAEIFIIPGFGVAGISGIVLMVAGLVFAMIDNSLLFDGGRINLLPLVKPISIVLLSSFSGLLVSIFTAGKLLDSKALPWLSLKTVLNDDDGFVGVDSKLQGLVGKDARVISHMRPSGKVEVDGNWYEATMENGIADKGNVVRITRFEGGRVYCENPPQ